MLPKKYLFPLLALLAFLFNLLFFFNILPLPVLLDYIVFWALLGGVISLIACMLFLSLLDIPWKNYLYFIYIPAIVLSLFGFAILLILNAYDRKAAEIKVFGANSLGYIQFLSNSTKVESEEYPVNISFLTQAGEKQNIEAYYTWQAYNEAYFNPYIPIRYSVKTPQLYNLLVTESENLKYNPEYKPLSNFMKQGQQNFRFFLELRRDTSDLCHSLRKKGYSNQQIDTLFQRLPVYLSESSESSGQWMQIVSFLMTAYGLITWIYNKIKG